MQHLQTTKSKDKEQSKFPARWQHEPTNAWQRQYVYEDIRYNVENGVCDDQRIEWKAILNLPIPERFNRPAEENGAEKRPATVN